MRFLRELRSLWRYRYRTPASDRALQFYSEHASYYAYYEGLIAALAEQLDHGLCYFTSDPHDPLLNQAPTGVHVFYLSSLLPFFMKFVRCRVFVMTLTDLDQFHIQRSINPVHYLYVFHAMNSTHMAYRPGAFDHYDSILCTGPYQVAELQRDAEQRSLRDRQLVEAGYYRLERIHAAAQFRKDESRNSNSGKAESDGRRILLAPSWAAGNILDSCGETLIDLLSEAGFTVVVRPHPETWKRFPDQIKQLETRFRQQPAVYFERSVAGDESMLEADLLITDWSGIALEYAFGTERPVLYIDVPRKVHNRDYESLGIEPFEVQMRREIGEILPVEDLPSVTRIAQQMITDTQTYGETLRALRTDHVFHFGRSSEVGAAHVSALLSAASSTSE